MPDMPLVFSDGKRWWTGRKGNASRVFKVEFFGGFAKVVELGS